jgi:cellulose synthase/poly-beta-1,6-N-acetylglucosamine synthase-like glycosyltransferase
MKSIEFLFWVSVGVLFYTFVGYAILVWLMVKCKGIFIKSMRIEPYYEPEVSLIVPCFNEAVVIEDKIKNCFELDYPTNKLRLIFITDGSDDGTNDILARYPGITVLHDQIRLGKSVAENKAMKFVKTPYVIFSDANTRLNKEAVREMVKHYQDENIGAVAGEKRIVSKEKDSAPAAGEGFYWKYESRLKRLDSELHSVVGGAGELISFRSDLFQPLEEDTLLDDFVQSMRITLKGYRVVYEPKAYAEERASATVKEELKRKVRISAGAWQAMSRLGKAFNPFHNFIIVFSFISHKVLRWTLAPLSLLMIIPTNYYLYRYSGGLYTFFWYAQVVFYSFTLLGWLFENNKVHVKILFIPYYFFMTNWCMFIGFARFVRGTQNVKWERSARGVA